MTYRENFVVAIKCATTPGKRAKVLREQNESVFLPFGSEYQITLKNLNTTRAAVRVYIDDVDVLGGSRLLIEPNEDCDLEGFLSGQAVTHKFKFIEKTEQISEHRGDRSGDGLVRVEYEFERKPDVHQTVVTHHQHHVYPTWPVYPYRTHPLWIHNTPHSGGLYRGLSTPVNYSTGSSSSSGSFSCSTGSSSGSSSSAGAGGSSSRSFQHEGTPCADMCHDSLADSEPVSRRVSLSDCSFGATKSVAEGITVKGGSSSQSFKSGHLGATDGVKHVICLKLMGYAPEKSTKVEREPLPVEITMLPDYNGVPVRLVKVGDHSRIASLDEIAAVQATLQALAEADASKKG